MGRVAIHQTTVHFRAAPQHQGDWLRRIDQWIGYAKLDSRRVNEARSVARPCRVANAAALAHCEYAAAHTCHPSDSTHAPCLPVGRSCERPRALGKIRTNVSATDRECLPAVSKYRRERPIQDLRPTQM